MRDTVKQRIERAGFPASPLPTSGKCRSKTHQQGRRDHHPRASVNEDAITLTVIPLRAEDNADEADHHAHGENWLAISGISRAWQSRPQTTNHYAGQDQQYQPVAGERALDDFILLFAEIAIGFVDAGQQRILFHA